MNRFMTLAALALLVVAVPGRGQPPSPQTGGGQAPKPMPPGAGLSGGTPAKQPGATPGPGGMMGSMGGGLTLKKEKDLKDMTLEERLAKALKDNPDLRVAETKVSDAEAQLNRTRLQVLQKVAIVHQDITVARAMLKAAEQLSEMAGKGATSSKERLETVLTTQRAKADLAKLEAELPYLLGKQPASTFLGRTDASVTSYQGLRVTAEFLDAGTAPAHPPPGPLAEVVLKALNTPVKVDFAGAPLREVIDHLQGRYLKGVNIHVSGNLRTNLKVTLTLAEPIPLGAVLQWLEDEFNCRCVLREYGIVISEDSALPPGAHTLLDEWKKSRARESKPK